MIQDIAPHVLDNQWKQGKKPNAKSPVFHFKGNTLLVNMAFLDVAQKVTEEAKELPDVTPSSKYLDLVEAVAYSLSDEDVEVSALADSAAETLTQPAENVSGEEVEVAAGSSIPFLPTYSQLYGRRSAMSVAMIVNGRMSNNNGSVTYLLTLDDTDYFFACGAEVPALPGYDYVSIAKLRQLHLPMEQMFLLMTALHLSHWYDKNHYCGHCGSRMVLAVTERACKCPACRTRSYPRINPAVIVGIRNGDKLLMTKYAGAERVPYFALVAGFAEIGESLEETVRRECMEEVGLKVKNITYYKSQPWGLADDLLAGFYCDVDGDDTIVMNKKELKVAEWYTREEITGQPDKLSLTNEMMLAFKAGNDPA